MAYFKINGVDYSMYVNELNITREANYNAQMNAHGDTVVDLINHKRTIEVGIIPLTDKTMKQLLTAIDGFSVTISFLNPQTGKIEENVACIIPESGVEYYTIQSKKVMFNAFTLTFTEL